MIVTLTATLANLELIMEMLVLFGSSARFWVVDLRWMGKVLNMGLHDYPYLAKVLPMISIVVPCLGYLTGS